MNKIDEILQILKSIDEKLGRNKIKKSKKASEPPSETVIFWEHYLKYYLLRWKVEPVRNAMINGMIKNISKRVPAEDYRKLIHFFISQNDKWYLQEMHHLRCLQKDCEMLLTRMKSGVVITSGKARMMENASDNFNEVQKFVAKDESGN